jgi:hypothetical protein
VEESDDGQQRESHPAAATLGNHAPKHLERTSLEGVGGMILIFFFNLTEYLL